MLTQCHSLVASIYKIKVHLKLAIEATTYYYDFTTPQLLLLATNESIISSKLRRSILPIIFLVIVVVEVVVIVVVVVVTTIIRGMCSIGDTALEWSIIIAAAVVVSFPSTLYVYVCIQNVL